MHYINQTLYKPYSFEKIDITLASNNPLHFREYLLERIQKLAITIDAKIRDEKLQHDTNREAAKITALSSGKIDKYEYLTGKEIVPPNQYRGVEHTKYTYSSLGKAIEEKIKIIENQEKK